MDSREMCFVRAGLYIGSQMAEMRPCEDLKKQGIAMVLQLGTGPFMQPSHPGLAYKCIPAGDFESVDLVKILIKEDALGFIDEGIQKGGILVHCQAGISRSATAVVAYLMTREHRLFEDALLELMKCRRYVAPNIGFCNQLKGLEGCLDDVKRYKGPDIVLKDIFDRAVLLNRLRKLAGTP